MRRLERIRIVIPSLLTAVRKSRKVFVDVALDIGYIAFSCSQTLLQHALRSSDFHTADTQFPILQAFHHGFRQCMVAIYKVCILRKKAAICI